MNLPVFNLLPNEHLLSWLVRSYKLSGNSSFLNFQNKLGIHDRHLCSNLVFTQALKRIIYQIEEPGNVIKYHTNIPIWQIATGRVLDNGNLNSLSHANEARHFGFGFDTSWHSCRKCRQYDLDKYGTTYWHTSHQLPSVFECYKYHCMLEKGVKPIENLLKEVLPHQVIAWEPVQSHMFKELKYWQCFVFKINKISHDQPTLVASIQSQFFEVFGLDLNYGTDYRRESAICELDFQCFESFLGPELIKYIFRNYTDLTLGGRRNLLDVISIDPICFSFTRNPVYWIALAYWQRANLNFD